MAGEIIVLHYLVNKILIKVSDLTMKTTTYSCQTSLVSTIHIYTHHVNKTINLLLYNNRKIKAKCKAPQLPYAIVSL